jgi:hypothetical protein
VVRDYLQSFHDESSRPVDDEDEDERVPAAASSKQLPSSELDKLWERCVQCLIGPLDFHC